MKSKLYIYSLIKNTISFFMWCIVIGFLLFLGKDKFIFIQDNFVILATISLVFLIVSELIFGTLEVRYWKYSWDDEKIQYQKGFLIVKQVLIPMVRVQQVTTVTNPLLKSWNLVEIHIITTTDTHTLLPIELEDGENFKNALTQKLLHLQLDEAGDNNG